MSEREALLEFLEVQKVKQASHFPTMRYDKVLSFMATTAQPGRHPDVAVAPLVAVEPGPTPSELRVRLRGRLPRPLERGECLTVHLTMASRFQGYQVKTRALPAPGSEGEIYEQTGPDELWVKGHQIFTVHHSPYTVKFFEQIPIDEVRQTVGGIRVALLGEGESANISPRFIFHYESRLERIVLYHGDGLALKTYMNLKANRQETRLVLDLDTFEGYCLRGTVEEFAPHQHPVAYDKICGGFTAGNWGKPSRVFRFVADQWTRLEPAAQ